MGELDCRLAGRRQPVECQQPVATEAFQEGVQSGVGRSLPGVPPGSPPASLPRARPSSRAAGRPPDRVRSWLRPEVEALSPPRHGATKTTHGAVGASVSPPLRRSHSSVSAYCTRGASRVRPVASAGSRATRPGAGATPRAAAGATMASSSPIRGSGGTSTTQRQAAAPAVRDARARSRRSARSVARIRTREPDLGHRIVEQGQEPSRSSGSHPGPKTSSSWSMASTRSRRARAPRPAAAIEGCHRAVAQGRRGRVATCRDRPVEGVDGVEPWHEASATTTHRLTGARTADRGQRPALRTMTCPPRSAPQEPGSEMPMPSPASRASSSWPKTRARPKKSSWSAPRRIGDPCTGSTGCGRHR